MRGPFADASVLSSAVNLQSYSREFPLWSLPPLKEYGVLRLRSDASLRSG